ncbi:MAG: hypothetical protein HC875_11805 [Anaerolineales bacterium]|nr:hypothetical protein [Anaerolineales bacterium]
MVTIKNRPEVDQTEAGDRGEIGYAAKTSAQFLEKNKTTAALTMQWFRLLNADQSGPRLWARWRLK